MAGARLRHYIDSDNLLEVVGLQNAVTSNYLNAASVTVTISDHTSGSAIAGETWPFPLTYVPASNGDYRGILGSALVILDQQLLIMDIIADAGTGLRHHWRIPALAEYNSML